MEELIPKTDTVRCWRNSTPKMCISCTSGMASIRLSGPALICSGLQRSWEQEEKKENLEKLASRWQFDCHGESKLGRAPWKISSRSCLSGGRGHQSCEEFGRSDGDKYPVVALVVQDSMEHFHSWLLFLPTKMPFVDLSLLLSPHIPPLFQDADISPVWVRQELDLVGPLPACDGWRQHADFGIWFSTVSRTGILLWSTSAYGQSHGDDSSSFARSDGSSSLKEVEYRSLQMIGDWHKIRERKSLGSCRFAFKRSDHFFWISSWQAEKKVCFAKNCRFRSG